jgi:ribonuclease HI
MEVVRVFTDGACMKNGREGSKASYACWFPDHKQLSKSGRVPEDQNQTNNRGELLAILQAVKIADDNFASDKIILEIYTDSEYSKNCLTIWLPGWIANKWKTSTGGDVKNRDLIEETTTLLKKFKYSITHVPAHTGGFDENSKNNEIVDRMAVTVLNPEAANVKIIHTNTQKAIEGLPIDLMGPPVNEKVLVNWCRENLDKLDEDLLNTALIQVLSKTVRKNGFELSKQKQHRGTIYRLIANNLIAENTVITKEE